MVYTISVLGLAVTTVLHAQADAQQLWDYMEQVRNETGVPGMSVAIAVGNEIVFSEGVGYAELDNKVLASGRTVHNVAIAQMFAVTVR